MARFRANPDDLRRVKANLEAYRQKQVQRYARALAIWADDTVGVVQAEILRVKALDQGLLHAATTRTDPERTGSKLKVIVLNPLEYATVVEWGRRPGKYAKLLPLVGWAKRKGIITHVPANISFGGEWAKKWAASAAILRNMKRGAGKAKSRRPIDPEVLDLLIVRLIARAIFEKGTKGRHPFSIAYEKRVRTFRADIRDALDLQGAD